MPNVRDYALTGPTEQKKYPFSGKKADAEQWEVSFTDGVKFPIIAPKAPKPGLHNHSVDQVADAASYLPKIARSKITKVVLNIVTNPEDPYWAAQYHEPGFHSYMTAGKAGVVMIYPDKSLPPDANEMRGTMIHETGHTWSYQQWGDDQTKGKWAEWRKAMNKDKVAVSGYAKKAIAEDVAETVKIYVATQSSPNKKAEYRKIVPNRFAMLDKEYK
jgi:hypothetical protein